MRRGLGSEYVDVPVLRVRRTTCRPRPTSSRTGMKRLAHKSRTAEQCEQAYWRTSRSGREQVATSWRRSTSPGRIFFARADEPWVLKGASVHISFVGQDDGSDRSAELDGQQVPRINANLTSGLDLTVARTLRENQGIAFMGDTKGGPFEIDAPLAQALLRAPNPDGRNNRDVIRRWVNGEDVNGTRPWPLDHRLRCRHDRGRGRPLRGAIRVRPHPCPTRAHQEPPGCLRRALVATRRATIWLPECHRAARPIHRDNATLAASALRVAVPSARSPTADSSHSRPTRTSLRGPPLTIRTRSGRRKHSGSAATRGPLGLSRTRRRPPSRPFHFPPPRHERRERVGEAACRLVELRDGWLNPPGLDPAELAKRTLTNLYNPDRPGSRPPRRPRRRRLRRLPAGPPTYNTMSSASWPSTSNAPRHPKKFSQVGSMI